MAERAQGSSDSPTGPQACSSAVGPSSGSSSGRRLESSSGCGTPKLDLFLAIADRARAPYEGLLTDLTARLLADLSLDPFAEFEKTVNAGFQALEANAERQRLLTILMLRCEYVEEMAPAFERQRRARTLFRAELDQIFTVIAARGRLAAPWRPNDAAAALFLVFSGMLRASLETPEELRLTVQGIALARLFLAAFDAARPRAAAAAASTVLPAAARG